MVVMFQLTSCCTVLLLLSKPHILIKVPQKTCLILVSTFFFFKSPSHLRLFLFSLKDSDFASDQIQVTFSVTSGLNLFWWWCYLEF